MHVYCNTVALLPFKGGSVSNSEARVVLEPDTISEPIVGLCSGCMARCICRISRFNKIPKLAPLFVFTTLGVVGRIFIYDHNNSW